MIRNCFTYPGVSILRVDSASVFERVGGTCLGGGTALGLFRLLTDHRDFTSLIELSEQVFLVILKNLNIFLLANRNLCVEDYYLF